MNIKTMYLICFILLNIASINAQTKYAKIVVYRIENNIEITEDVYKIFADENLTTVLKNKHFEEFYMPEGSFKLNVNDVLSSSIRVKCIKSNTYYFKINRDLKLQDNPIIITAMDSTTALNEIKFTKKTVVKKTGTYVPQQNRIGVFIQPGLGFDNVEVLSTNIGSAMLSFGYKGSIGLSYSYLFSNNLGWSVELQDQFSSLTPSVDNASVIFNRGVISTTPFFTIPILKRIDHKLKIGAGIDYHFNPTLIIETNKIINGFDDKWRYNNTFGFHIIAFYDMKLNKNLRGHMGIKYNDVRYTFASGKTFQPSTDDMKAPRGNSVAVSLGFEYCF